MGGDGIANVTIKTIAARAGVSIGTVDRVIHNRDGVKPETRELIQRICQDLGYQSDAIAKALAFRKKEKHIAVIINAPERNLFSSRVKEGFDSVSETLNNYNIFFDYYLIKSHKTDEMVKILEGLDKEAVAGIIIKPLVKPRVVQILRDFIGRGIPVITCTSDIPDLDTLCFVGQNHKKEGRIAAALLEKQLNDGDKIAVITGDLSVLARKEKAEGFIGHIRGCKKKIEICENLETINEEDVIFAEAYSLLKRNPQIKALYTHTPTIKPVIKAVRLLGMEDLTVFTFGSLADVKEDLLNGNLAFAIVEDAFRHGYDAGQIMFDYLFMGKEPSKKKMLLNSQIMVDESVRES